MVSDSWSQRGHLSGRFSHLLCSLSAVQHLPKAANQRFFFAFRRWPGLPDSLPMLRLDWSNKKTFISCFGRVLSVWSNTEYVFVIPLRANLSVVQHLLWDASQMKILHLLGAHVSQILSTDSKSMEPVMKRSYADLEEYSPVAVGSQQSWSETPGCNWTSWVKSHIKKPIRTSADRLPVKSDTHLLFSNQCVIFWFFLGMQLRSAGASSPADFPCIHRSSRSKVFWLLPTIEQTETENRVAAFGCTCMSNSDQGRSGWGFLSHNNLIFKDQPKTSKLRILRLTFL